MSTSSTNADFTLDAYRRLICGLLDHGYALRSFQDADPGQRHLILRHDIDQSLRSARTMADLEAGQRWTSTWFVLVRTEMYNPFSREAVSHLRAMRDAGHTMGLHLDASHYESDVALEQGCALECRMLEDILGSEVPIVSFHRPRPSFIGRIEPIGGRLHSYMPRFTREMGYCSDSRGEWRHGHPLNHPSLQAGRALQLLTHAVWWVGPEGRDATGRLADVLREKATIVSDELAANNDVWRMARRGQKAPAQRASELDSIRIVDFDASLFAAKATAFLDIASDVPGEYWEARHFTADLPDKWQLSFAMMDGQIPVAYAIASRKAGASVHLHHFMVHRDWRRLGLSRRMMQELQRRARLAKARSITLKVPADNIGAQRLYASAGFCQIGRSGDFLLLETLLE